MNVTNHNSPSILKTPKSWGSGNLWPPGLYGKQLPNNSAIVHFPPWAKCCSLLHECEVTVVATNSQNSGPLCGMQMLIFLRSQFLYSCKRLQHSCMSPWNMKPLPTGWFPEMASAWKNVQGFSKHYTAMQEEPRVSQTASPMTPALPLTAVVRLGKNHSFMKRFLMAIAWQSVYHQSLAGWQGEETWSWSGICCSQFSALIYFASTANWECRDFSLWYKSMKLKT